MHLFVFKLYASIPFILGVDIKLFSNIEAEFVSV